MNKSHRVLRPPNFADGGQKDDSANIRDHGNRDGRGKQQKAFPERTFHPIGKYASQGSQRNKRAKAAADIIDDNLGCPHFYDAPLPYRRDTHVVKKMSGDLRRQ